MIRNYTRKTGEKTDFVVLNKLKSAASTAVAYVPTKLEKTEYDQSTLDGVTDTVSDPTKISQEAAAKAAKETADAYAENTRMNAETAAGMSKSINTSDDSESNVFTMIMQIVPIGVNVIRKSKNIAEGFTNSIMGIVNLIKNVAIVSAIFTIDTIEYFTQLLYYLFKLMICAVSNLGNIHKCVLFYLFDVFIFAVKMCIMSVLFIIDMFFMIKRLTGISCVEAFLMVPELISKLDEMIYKYTSVHLFRYPAPIIKMCYTCSAMGDTSGFKRASASMFNVVFRMMPKDIGGPIGSIFKGIGQIFSFFDF